MFSIIERIKAVILRLLPSRKQDEFRQMEEVVSDESSSDFLNEEEEKALLKIINGRKMEKRQVERARILFTFNQVKNITQTAEVHRTDRKNVRKWRERWEEARPYLRQIAEQKETFGARIYLEAIKTVLDDAPRSGAPDTFTPEQRVQIVALACEVLDDDSESPVSHWTQKQIADEAMRRGIVETISTSTIGRILQEAHLKPHRSRYWMNAPDLNTKEFKNGVENLCDLYAQVKALHEQGVHVMSTDEKTGIQALERAHPTHPAQPGSKKEGIERREHNYHRHGTWCLIANFEVATGKIVTPTIGPTRTEQDFLEHIQKTVAQDADGEWVFIVDQLNTHMSESLVLWVISTLDINIDEKDLGKKYQSGLLKSMKTRRNFLADPTHRIRFVYTPRHASWLNQVEIWFSILTRRLLKRGSFDSLQTLQDRMSLFIHFFNETMAKPHRFSGFLIIKINNLISE
jgi:hypothetical protein